jgi:glycolate oxidase iron-sulfur subunit
MFDFMDMAFDNMSSDTGMPIGGPYIPAAGECMRCGMCVSSCPTFRLFQIDEETPRRRIRTLSKLLVEDLQVSAKELTHLDNCVQCRACETACPSKMAYGQLFDQALEQRQLKPKLLAKLGFYLIEHKRWRLHLLAGIAVYLHSGLRKPLQRSGLLTKFGLANAEAMLVKPTLWPLAASYPARVVSRGRVALFTGCLAEHLDRETLLATIRLLNVTGYEVLVPEAQGCCGAIHQHNGQSAADLMANNITVFNALDVKAVLYAASGCGAMLSEYQTEDSAASQRFTRRLVDVNEFLLTHWPEDLQLMPSSRKVAVHEPCSQRNVLKNQSSVYALLQKIPELQITALADNQLCCGAGGTYLLSHPQNAGRLREMKQQCIVAAEADNVVSSNFVCAAYLDIEGDKAYHPLVLLAGQLPTTNL